MTTFETTIDIARPPADVFRFVADGRNASQWNSAIQEVRKITDGPVGTGTEYWMSRELPNGRVENTFRVEEYEPDVAYGIRTTTGPTPFVYRYRFERSESGTRLTLSADAELGVPKLLSPLAAAAVKRGVDANFRTLKQLLEGHA